MQEQENQINAGANQNVISDAFELEITATGKLRVIKRNCKVVPFEHDKIKIAVTKAFLSVESGGAAASERIHNKVESITQGVLETFGRRMPSGGTLHIEEIQDQVELQLMRSEEHPVARNYILYREERAQERHKTSPKKPERKNESTITITKGTGEKVPLDVNRITKMIEHACEGLEDVKATIVVEEALKNLYDGVSVSDMRASLIMSARTKVELEPNYSYVTARILLDELRAEALSFLGVAEQSTQQEMSGYYPKALQAFIEKGIELEMLNPELKNFDLDKIGKAINPQNDYKFTYLGLQTLYDRYFIHSNDIRYELPQIFFMRVAMGLAIEEEDRENRAIEFYNLLSVSYTHLTLPTI